MECESMLFVKNHIPYLWNLSNSFSNSFNDFYSCESFHQEIYQKEWSIKLRVENGGWHESLNLLHVSGYKMLHFVTSYMKQNKSRKQTLESAQYGLEISFKARESKSTEQYDCKLFFRLDGTCNSMVELSNSTGWDFDAIKFNVSTGEDDLSVVIVVPKSLSACTETRNAGTPERRKAGTPERRNTKTRNTKLLKPGTHEK